MGNLGFQPRLSRPSCKDRNKAATFNLNATHYVSDNENVHHRQTYGGIPMSHPAYPQHLALELCFLFVRLGSLCAYREFAACLRPFWFLYVH